MKKRLLSLALAALLLLPAVLPAAALVPGDAMGWVLYTNIGVKINGVPIRAYNIDGLMYVVAEDLADYGFHVLWQNIGDGFLYVSDGSGVVTASYTPERNTHRAGDRAMPYYYTRILTFIAGEPVFARNIGGYTCISVDDLAYFYADELVWDPTADELRLTLRPDGSSVIPGDWEVVYDTPGYDADRETLGEGAMWEFTKDESGTFVLTDSAGTTDFALQIRFGDDQMSYRVHFVEKWLTLTGSRIFRSAPHSIAAHRVVTDGVLRPDDGNCSPYNFRAYVMQDETKANALRDASALARAAWRVSYNGEEIDGIPATQITAYYQSLIGRTQTWEEFTLCYSRRYPLETVDTVRIELRVPADYTDPDLNPVQDDPYFLEAALRDTTKKYCGHSFSVRAHEDSDARVSVSFDDAGKLLLSSVESHGQTYALREPIELTDPTRQIKSVSGAAGQTAVEVIEPGVRQILLFFTEAGMQCTTTPADGTGDVISLRGAQEDGFNVTVYPAHLVNDYFTGGNFAEIVDRIVSREEKFYTIARLRLTDDGFYTVTPLQDVTLASYYESLSGLDTHYADYRRRNPDADLPASLDEYLARDRG